MPLLHLSGVSGHEHLLAGGRRMGFQIILPLALPLCVHTGHDLAVLEPGTHLNPEWAVGSPGDLT